MNEQGIYLPPAAPIKTQQQVDAEQLGMLEIGHYVLGAIFAFSSCMALIYVVFGALMIHYPHTFNPPPAPPRPGQPADVPLPFNPGYFVMGFGLLILLFGWGSAALTAYAGRCMAKRKHYVFILIVTGLGCASMGPLNTTLGVLSFIVLLRPTVKALFEQSERAVGAANGRQATLSD